MAVPTQALKRQERRTVPRRSEVVSFAVILPGAANADLISDLAAVQLFCLSLRAGREQTSRRCQSGTVVSGPYQRACSAGSGSLLVTAGPTPHQILALAAVLLPRVPGWDFIPSPAGFLPQPLEYRRPPSIPASLGTAARTGYSQVRWRTLPTAWRPQGFCAVRRHQRAAGR